MAAKQILFFATKDDLKDGLERVEEAGDIKYVVTGLFDTPELHEFNSFKDIEGIGLSKDGQLKSLVTYLIVFREEILNSREVPQRNGGLKYAMDGRTVNASITFTPSGVYEDKCILYGTVSGVDDSNERSRKLFKIFDTNFFKGFKKVRCFKVSKDALEKLDGGMRLTRNYNAEPSMDLVR